jgi:hypothetical protein
MVSINCSAWCRGFLSILGPHLNRVRSKPLVPEIARHRTSVAEPEPVGLHHFAGAGARPTKFRLWLRSRVCKFTTNVIKTLKLSFKITILLLFTLKNLLMIIYVFKKPENFLKTWKSYNFMRKMVRAGAGIFDKQEPEPHKNGPAPQHCIER